MTTTTTHPIDHAIVAFLFLVEGVCWIINELAGFHAEPETTEPETIDVVAIETPLLEPAEEPESVDLSLLKVVDLRRMAKGLTKGVHLMRKTELVELLAAA